MSTIPYNYGKYIDDKMSMSNSGTVDAGRQVQSPASAGSRGLAKTTQFTKDPTQMKMGNSPIAESIIEIRNILNRIDGVNVPVKEDNMQDLAIHDIEAQLGKINDEITFLQIDQKDKESALAALGELRSVLDKYQSQQESAVNELARLKELSGIEEDTNDDIIQWAKKYSQYKNLEDDNLIEALYEYAFELGIAQLTFEVGELQAAERKIGKKQEDWEDAEINAAMEMSPISNGLLDDLHRILPGNADLEQKLDSIRGMLEKAGLKEDKYQPFPEGDEFDIEEDEDFEEVLGPLGFPEDETELFDAEYQGRKVPLNKPMRGDSKKFKVYVKDPKTGNVKKVNFGHGGTSAKKLGQKTMKIRKSNPKARKSFRARHNCANPGPKTSARYWSCRKW
jgi:hypothetical protein